MRKMRTFFVVVLAVLTFASAAWGFSITCPSCGAPNSDTSKFCSSCGENLAFARQQSAFCSECGSQLESDWNYCPFCGTKRDSFVSTTQGGRTTKQGGGRTTMQGGRIKTQGGGRTTTQGGGRTTTQGGGRTSTQDDPPVIEDGGSVASSAKPVPQGFVQLSAGAFTRGVDQNVGYNNNEAPAHRVTLTRSFAVCDHEVTQREFKSVMGALPEGIVDSKGKGDNCPVYFVNWYHAIAYCNKLSIREGRTPCYDVSGISNWATLPYSSIPTSYDTAWNAVSCDWNADGYRLPTEAEWEYAARAGNGTSGAKTWSGTSSESSLAQYAWYSSNSKKAQDVRGTRSNAKGLYDMSGNVWEWCWDGFEGDRYTKDKAGVTDPEGAPSVSSRATRGGAYDSGAASCTVSRRDYNSPQNIYGTVGFRVVCTAPGSARTSAPAFVQMTAGAFTRGVDQNVGYNNNESPAHRVTLTRSFYICDHEVTQKEFNAVMSALPEKITVNGGKGDDFPVYFVNWYHAIAYCNKRSIKEGLTPCYDVSGITNWAALPYASIPTTYDAAWNAVSCDWNADGYRLPTEAEWEYASRAGNGTTDAKTWSGITSENSLLQYAWYGSATSTHTVRKRKANAKGLYDMSGNVWEWCWDGFEGDRYTKDKAGVTDPEGSPSVSSRATRGGACDSGASSCLVSRRDYNSPQNIYGNVGFRVVRTAPGSGKTTTPTFVKMSAGAFTMGVDRDVGYNNNETPAHRVTLTRSFYICDHEVTQKEFSTVMGVLPEGVSSNGGKGDDFPVYSVNWYHAIAYCNKRSIREGRTPCYEVSGVTNWATLAYSSIPTSFNTAWNAVSCNWDANGYRLPTEAEWEYAARAGNGTTNAKTWSGITSENSLPQYAWYGSATSTHTVRRKKANARELYDMSGNVWEWCWDGFEGDRYAKDLGGVTDPEGASSGSSRTTRGGACDSGATSCLVSRRDYNSPQNVYGNVGFRVVCTARDGDNSFVQNGGTTTTTQTSRPTTTQGGGRTAASSFVQMSAGAFTMGVDQNVGYNNNESPAHRVTLTRSFAICDHEVTQKEFKAVMGAVPEKISDSGGKGDNYPVYFVNWYHAIAYCNKLSIKEGLTPCYEVSGVSNWATLPYSSIPTSYNNTWNAVSCDWEADGYRLPTEAEWEYAARAGNGTSNAKTWSGIASEASLTQYAWFGGATSTHTVKRKKANAKRLYDMSGNVWEWCWDGFEGDRYAKEKAGVTDPEGGPSGSSRATRGGACDSGAASCTVSRRDYNSPQNVYATVGFRVVRTMD